jgi:pyruvate,orthophosphate dikinase
VTLVHDIDAIDPADLARFGGKAAGLARMRRLGLRVPPAFVVETAACALYQSNGRRLPAEVIADCRAQMARLEQVTGKTFAGGDGIPLLVSVRSGAMVSMPGMMDTVLNLGLDSESVLRLATACADPRFALDTWTRFWAMFCDIVLEIDSGRVLAQAEDARKAAAAHLDAGSAGALQEAILAALADEVGPVPVNPWEHLEAAARAVLDSWDSRRARLYRDHHGIRHDLGTAITVQAMVFGNLGRPAGSGVAFTRDPSTGEARLYGEYLAGGQGEDVVAGTKTPVSLSAADSEWAPIVAELERCGKILEQEYRDALDIEFTVESGTLYLLQVRPAKRSAAAAVHMATTMVSEGLIEPRTAVRRVSTEQVRRLVSPEFDPDAVAAARAAGRLLTTGVPASPGQASGRAALDADRAVAMAAGGLPVVLVRPTTSPQDLRGMLAADAIVTACGGATSHAAVVSRALDKPCVVGCQHMEVRVEDRVFVAGGLVVEEGETISIDGASGEVLLGDLPRRVPTRNLDGLSQLLTWADDISGVALWTEATSALPVEVARRTRSAGLGIVPLTDLLQASGGLPVLLGAIARYSDDPGAPTADIEDPLAEAVRAALLPLLADAADLPVDLRLPNLTSVRARTWVEKWTALAPHLLMPLGAPRLIAAYAAGARAAAGATNHPALTLLAAGITTAAELDEFATMVGPDLAAGAVLQNPAVLADSEALLRGQHALWVDLAELVRTTLGRPEELLYTDAPATLPPLLTGMMRSLCRPNAGGRVGVRLTGNSLGAATALYDLGFRVYSSSAAQAGELRLLFGQHMTQEDDR